MPEPSRKRCSAPRFYPRKAYLSRDYYVLVVWPEGNRQKVGCFANRQDAALWVQHSAGAWLATWRRMAKARPAPSESLAASL
ncbi:MAG: hypothetical protein P4L57_11050 [Rhizomicrobium sp.]|nr:hypothetical protein [Rhizomicrobium sp.]